MKSAATFSDTTSGIPPSTRDELTDLGLGLAGFASRLAFAALNISVNVDDLVKGKRIDCKDIVEMLAVEEQLREASPHLQGRA